MDTHEALNNVPIILFESATGFEQWLEIHYAEPRGIWVKIAKKHSGQLSVSYAEALEVALCYGWIDGQKRTYDEQFFLQKFTPRRARSVWSKVNVDKAKTLIAQRRMKPSGLIAIEAARKDGRWDQAYDSASTMTMPADFIAALDQHPQAKEFYATLNKANIYAILWRIQTTKTAQTRHVKIAELIDMLERGQKIH